MSESPRRVVPTPQSGAGSPGPGGSSGARRALIVANDTYDHPSLSQLRAPEADARALADVLGDPEIGGFEVSVVHNAASYEVQTHIEDLFADSRPEDLVLLHFSGHGLKNDAGELFIAARNTRPDRLVSTSVPADFVQRCMRGAIARTIVLFLDCCYGGAFGEGVTVRAAGPVNVMESFPAGRLGGGRGRAVISASSAMEYAFEGTTLTADHEVQPSVFTSAVVDGLRSGDADRDEDGLVSLGELYEYVFDRVREQNPRQTPGRDVEMSGEVYLARSRRKRIRPLPIPDRIADALREPDPTYRRGAVLELRDRLGHPDLGVALGALEALQEVVRSDIRLVADDAAAFLAAAAPGVSPSSLAFDAIAPGSAVDVEQEVRVSGIPLAREVHVEAEPPLTAIVAGDTVTVTFAPTGGPYAGSLTITSPTGSVVVPVTARLSTDGVSEPSPATGLLGPAGVGSAGAGSAEPEAGSPPATVPTPEPHVEEVETTSAATTGDAPPVAVRSETDEAAARVRRMRIAAGTTAVVGGVFTMASMLLPWLGSDSSASFESDLVLNLVVFGVLAITAGAALLAVASPVALALGLLAGTAVATALGLVQLLGTVLDGRGDTPGQGWSLSLVGHLVVLAAAVVALGGIRGVLTFAGIRWSRPWVVIVSLAAVVGVLCIADWAMYLGTADVPGYWVFTVWVWVVAALVTPAVALSLAPAAAGRAMVASWAVGLFGIVVPASWLAVRSGGEGRFLWVTAVSCGVLLVASLVASLVGRQGDVQSSGETQVGRSGDTGPA
ncbi:hypothetical protein N865_16035 [Intrasporangium oryzae NRRL B-24470]|uniref:Peptidase C14 caspase domain-containing protein n=1 Tax=Intrasporangium oryzae NRRL B-24470 TaxID=1386089 RepID=W9G2Y6_9MICO|nr:caspase family protein [Intrasporangium oryzae]EWT00365.1 hypothetical protein N865_16035 [Intrasporangium oryzae NRRL B-24470]